MTQARASHLRLVVTEAAPVAVRLPRLRFQPVVRLADGAAFGMHAEADIAFEDTFNPRHLNDASLPSAAAWLGDLIERAGRLAQDAGTNLRPISITAPLAALADRDGPMAAEAGARRADLLPQEFRIEFPDAAVTGLEDLALDRVDAFRRKGFRVGLDARKSWRMPMGARARMSFEAVRVDVARSTSSKSRSRASKSPPPTASPSSPKTSAGATPRSSPKKACTSRCRRGRIAEPTFPYPAKLGEEKCFRRP